MQLCKRKQPARVDVRNLWLCQPVSCMSWFDVEGGNAPVAVSLWPLAVAASAGGASAAERDPLVWMAPCLRCGVRAACGSP